MLPLDTLFNQSSYFQPHPHLDDLYSPWSQEVNSYHFSTATPRKEKQVNTRRYTSQLQGYRRDSKEKQQPAQQRYSILGNKSVTIAYDENTGSRGQTLPNKIKLPLLAPRKSTELSQKRKAPVLQQSWQLLQRNNQSSLRKYRTKPHAQTPHLQIYKRCLIAARRSITLSLANPEPTADVYSHL